MLGGGLCVCLFVTWLLHHQEHKREDVLSRLVVVLGVYTFELASLMSTTIVHTACHA